VSVLMKNGNGQLLKFYSHSDGSKSSRKYKLGILHNLKLDSPLVCWPKDKAQLVALINYHLAQYDLNTLSRIDEIAEKKRKKKIAQETPATETEENLTMEVVEEEYQPNIEYIDEKEYIDIPDEVYEVEGCSEKVLGIVIRILNYRAKVLRKIDKMKALRATPEQVGLEIEKVVVYNIVLAKYLPILNSYDSIQVLNIKNATKLFEDVCTEGYEEIPSQAGIESEIKKNKEEQDFDIVSALAYVGLVVDKDDYGHYSIKGTNSNGIKYFLGEQEKTFGLSKDSCHRFVDEFLNRPIENRKFITPGQVFISYINEAEKGLGLNTRSAVELDEIFGKMANTKSAKAYFREVIKRYSRNAKEWKDFQKLYYSDYYANKENKDDLTNKIHIKQQAKRLVIGEMFEELLNGQEILSNEQLSISDYRASDISRDFGLNIDLSDINVNKAKVEKLEDQAFRLINSMHGILLEMRVFVQDIIDNYTVDYLRKEKIFLLQQDDQKEYITKKKNYEDLIDRIAIDKGKDSDQQIAYYQSQIDELTQKIGNTEYKDAKNTLLKSKNNFRILLLNAKSQKEIVKMNIDKAVDKAKDENRQLSMEDKVEIIRQTLSSVPELVVTFDKGKAVSWIKHKEGEQFDKKTDKLSDVDKIIEKTAAKISDESHQKILEENKVRESVKKAQKEERVKSVNAYINAYGSIVGSAGGVGAYNGMPMPNIPQNYGNVASPTIPLGGPTFGINAPYPQNPYPSQPYPQGYPVQQPIPQAPMRSPLGGGASIVRPVAPVAPVATPIASSVSSNVIASTPTPVASAPVQTVAPAPVVSATPTQVVSTPVVASTPVVVAPATPVVSGGSSQVNTNNSKNNNEEYQNFDFVSDNVEPCIIPYIVGYEDKGVTVYGNAMEGYATYDRYKFLLTTDNNVLYTYIDGKKAQIQTPEQIINDIHIRYVKVAMKKSGFATLDSNLTKFDYTGDVRKFLAQYIPQNIIDTIIEDYKELIDTIDYNLLKDLIEHRFAGDLENYIPDNVKDNVMSSATIIATVAKAIMTDGSVRRTFEAYSSKMKQSYINSLIAKIESGEIPKVSLSSDEAYERMGDYLSFSIKAQNVIIQNEDEKENGFDTYPRAIFFRQKNCADKRLKSGKNLSFEQNEMLTTGNQADLSGNKVVNLFGILYKFNGAYNKLLLKLKPFTLNSGVKFMENLIDALSQTIDIKATVLVDETKKPVTNLVKFASKEKEKKEISAEDITYDYEDDKWFVRRGFVLDKSRIKEYYFLMAFGFKYGLEPGKTQLKEDFYQDGLLSLNKINEKFNDFPEDSISIITQVIRNVMMSKCERVVDYIAHVNNEFNGHFNKVLYINKTIWESNSFDKKTKEEKVDALDILETDFNTKSEDLVNPHPEIYASIEDIEAYQTLYLYYALFELFEKMSQDERIVSESLSTYYADYKKKLRSQLLAKIRDKIQVNGYEREIAKYFELNLEKIVDLEEYRAEAEDEEENTTLKEKVRIQNIDVIFRGIQEGFNKAIKNETNAIVLSEMEEVGKLLEFVGELPNKKNPEKDLEIALPNNQSIVCNIKGFMQQYLFRYIVDKDHELGPFAYVVSELCQHEELVDVVKNIEIVADRLNVAELGINLFASFSSITETDKGHVFKIGDNISTVLETINRLKTPTDMQKALNRDIFYKEGVLTVQRCFEDYFNKKKLEQVE